ncbi:hypothetical protein GCM10023210_22850 [Chryseobacterium ginsengisoli]|uniref:SF4 helicase domain-containing protein n=1 Tax=Chryseobacterium ginsengisoli TaxID=363853 RepID=A0ABP9MBJ2_9FLAO
MITTGFIEIDKKINWLEIPALIVVGGIPSGDIVSFLTSLIKNLSIDNNIPTTYFNFQSNNNLLFNRFISNITEIPLKKFLTKNFSDDELHKIFSKENILKDSPIVFEQNFSDLNIKELKAKIINSIQQNSSRIFIFDNIQTLHNLLHNNDSSILIDQTIRELKSISKELDITIIFGSDINDANKRLDKRPKLLDFYSYTQIEDIADLIFLIYVPKSYKITVWDNDEDGMETSTENQAELIIAKNRNGATGTVRLSYFMDIAKFENLNGFSHYHSPNGFNKIKTTIDLESAFGIKQNTLSMNDDDDDFTF